VAQGKQLPTELRKDAKEMGGKDLVLDEAQQGESRVTYGEIRRAHAIDPGHIDDEYAKVGTYDPKIVITTSRSPSSRLLQFSKVCQSRRGR
jgi:U3 small nucleolar ribonucleoprotein protein IMP4